MVSNSLLSYRDIVYSLLGIFGVFLPLIYGEGKVHAHKRLRAEIDGLPSRVADSASMPTTVRSWAPSPKSTSTLANLRSPTRTAENSQQSRVVICYKCSSGTTHPIQLAIVSADKIMRKARNLAIMQTICTVINVCCTQLTVLSHSLWPCKNYRPLTVFRWGIWPLRE